MAFPISEDFALQNDFLAHLAPASPIIDSDNHSAEIDWNYVLGSLQDTTASSTIPTATPLSHYTQSSKDSDSDMAVEAISDVDIQCAAELSSNAVDILALIPKMAAQLQSGEQGPNDLYTARRMIRVGYTFLDNFRAIVDKHEQISLAALPKPAIETITRHLALIAPPATKRWKRHNMGWVVMLRLCSYIRKIVQADKTFWGMVWWQLPRVAELLVQHAGDAALTVYIDSRTPTPISSDRHKAAAYDATSLRRLPLCCNASRITRFWVTSMRMDIISALAWLHNANPVGLLPLLEELVLEAPNYIDATASDQIYHYLIHNPGEAMPLTLPNCRIARFRNTVCIIHADLLAELVIWYDVAPMPTATKLSLHELLNVLEICSALQHLELRDAIRTNSSLGVDRKVTLPMLNRLDVYDQCDAVNGLLDSLSWPNHTNVYIHMEYQPLELGSEHKISLTFKHLMINKHASTRVLQLLRTPEILGFATTHVQWSTSFTGPRPPDRSGAIVVSVSSVARLSWEPVLLAAAQAFAYYNLPPLYGLSIRLPMQDWSTVHMPTFQLIMQTFRAVNYVYPLTIIAAKMMDIPPTARATYNPLVTILSRCKPYEKYDSNP